MAGRGTSAPPSFPEVHSPSLSQEALGLSPVVPSAAGQLLPLVSYTSLWSLPHLHPHLLPSSAWAPQWAERLSMEPITVAFPLKKVAFLILHEYLELSSRITSSTKGQSRWRRVHRGVLLVPLSRVQGPLASVTHNGKLVWRCLLHMCMYVCEHMHTHNMCTHFLVYSRSSKEMCSL